jgi:hypothetical protein
MAKKKQPIRNQPGRAQQEPGNMLSDHINSDVLEKLILAKKNLQDAERELEEERQAQALFERNHREKNKSFEELLDDYGTKGNKY